MHTNLFPEAFALKATQGQEQLFPLVEERCVGRCYSFSYAITESQCKQPGLMDFSRASESLHQLWPTGRTEGAAGRRTLVCFLDAQYSDFSESRLFYMHVCWSFRVNCNIVNVKNLTSNKYIWIT